MPEVKVYRVVGRFYKDKIPKVHRFTKEVRALKEEDAKELVYSDIGSRHKVKRNRIKIERIEEMSVEEAVDPTIKFLGA